MDEDRVSRSTVVERVAHAGAVPCAICKRRPVDVWIPIRDARGAGSLGYQLPPARVRIEPWCVPCAQAVVDRSLGETVWCQPGGGYGNWLPPEAIP